LNTDLLLFWGAFFLGGSCGGTWGNQPVLAIHAVNAFEGVSCRATGSDMPKSLLLYAQLFTFSAGFFASAAISQVVRHPSSTLWIDFSILSVVFLLASRQYARKLKRTVGQSTL